jgi:hypothetical protein
MSLPLQYATRTALSCSEAYRAPNILRPQVGRKSYAKKLGLRFEKKVSTALAGRYKVELQPHYRFLQGEKLQSAFPDVLLHLPDAIVIAECKLRHTYDAWNQLTNLYLPILRKAHPGVALRRLEIVRNYDPSVRLPEPADVTFDLDGWLRDPKESYGVLIWGR